MALGSLRSLVGAALRSGVPPADLHDRDPDYLRDNLAFLWLLASFWHRGEVRGLDNAHCEMKNVSSAVTVEEGESVVTTGLDRIYPKGLLVGTVERIDQDPNAPFNKIIIKLTAPVDRLEHVLVLLVEAKDLKIDEATK